MQLATRLAQLFPEFKDLLNDVAREFAGGLARSRGGEAPRPQRSSGGVDSSIDGDAEWLKKIGRVVLRPPEPTISNRCCARYQCPHHRLQDRRRGSSAGGYLPPDHGKPA